MQSMLEQYHLYSLAPAVLVRLRCLTGSCEHMIWLTLFPFYHARSSPLLPSPLPNKQLISGYHIPISTGFEFLFGVYAIVSLITSDFDSDFVKLLPVLLSVTSCCFSFCCLVRGTMGQCRPSARTLFPFVTCSILQLLVSLSCQRHHKTERAICTCILTHTCLCHLLLY